MRGTAPLAGLKVVELARILAGPWIAQTLADLGAEVIKVEAPEGDNTRRWAPPFIERTRPDGTTETVSACFHSANRSKTSVMLDFNTPEELARQTDRPYCDQAGRQFPRPLSSGPHTGKRSSAGGP